MTVLAVFGDCATTSALALAAGWPAEERALVVEADRRGGSLAAWLDVPLSPSLSTVVTTLHAADSSGDGRSAWTVVDPLVRRAPSGTRFVPAPFRAREAGRAVAEAERLLVPLLAARHDLAAIVDLGRLDLVDEEPATIRHADAAVLCHRQEPSSARAASVRLERLAEQVDALRGLGCRPVLALIGEEPFGGDEVARFLGEDVEWRPLAPDPLAAAVLAGRSGVSERRLARLPLLRTARRLVDDLRGVPALGARPGASA
jgi:hypothetical protein